MSQTSPLWLNPLMWDLDTKGCFTEMTLTGLLKEQEKVLTGWQSQKGRGHLDAHGTKSSCGCVTHC